MVLAIARRGGSLVATGRRTALLANGAARTSNVVAVLPRQQFSNMPPNPPFSGVTRKERPEFKDAKMPVDNIEFKETGVLTTIDRLSNIMFMAEIFRAMWLSFEVRVCVVVASKLSRFVFCSGVSFDTHHATGIYHTTRHTAGLSSKSKHCTGN